MPLYKTREEAEKTLRAYISDNPSMGYFCKKNWFAIVCPECEFGELCRTFDYDSSDEDKRINGVERRQLFPSHYIPATEISTKGEIK